MTANVSHGTYRLFDITIVYIRYICERNKIYNKTRSIWEYMRHMQNITLNYTFRQYRQYRHIMSICLHSVQFVPYRLYKAISHIGHNMRPYIETNIPQILHKYISQDILRNSSTYITLRKF